MNLLEPGAEVGVAILDTPFSMCSLTGHCAHHTDGSWVRSFVVGMGNAELRD